MGDLSTFLELFDEPFIHRALIGGFLTGSLGGLIGSFAVLRQLSFFSDALGHSALLGITLGILLNVNPTFVLIPFAIIFAFLVNNLVERSSLPADALLNIVYSSSLAAAVLALSKINSYSGSIKQLLFGDILGITASDIYITLILFIVSFIYLVFSLRSHVLLTLDEDLAGSIGINTRFHKLAFIILLGIVVSVSIKSVGVLLISAFVVIPACAGRLISRKFSSYIVFSMVLGGLCALFGLILSGFFNLPSGPSIVILQFFAFLFSLIFSRAYNLVE